MWMAYSQGTGKWHGAELPTRQYEGEQLCNTIIVMKYVTRTGCSVG